MRFSLKLAIVALLATVVGIIVVLFVISVFFPFASETYLGYLVVTVTSSVLILITTVVAQTITEGHSAEYKRKSELRQFRERQYSELHSPLVFILRNLRDKSGKFYRFFNAAKLFTKKRLISHVDSEDHEPLDRLLIDFLINKLALVVNTTFRNDLLTFCRVLTVYDYIWENVRLELPRLRVNRIARLAELTKELTGHVQKKTRHLENYSTSVLSTTFDEPLPSYESFPDSGITEGVEEILELLGIK